MERRYGWGFFLAAAIAVGIYGCGRNNGVDVGDEVTGLCVTDSIYMVQFPEVKINAGTIYEHDSTYMRGVRYVDTTTQRACPCRKDTLESWGIYGVQFYAFKDSALWQTKIQLPQ